tara:strand:+ start:1430 stop:1765 length:336 start_codon:yes stop_codon:yes gene_type:complete
MDNDKVINFCGNYPENYEEIEIGNNPNFIFQNDPNYSRVQLWDIEANSVIVNSFIECEHYVIGGWTYGNPELENNAFSSEASLQIALLITVMLFTLSKSIINKTIKSKLYE